VGLQLVDHSGIDELREFAEQGREISVAFSVVRRSHRQPEQDLGNPNCRQQLPEMGDPLRASFGDHPPHLFAASLSKQLLERFIGTHGTAVGTTDITSEAVASVQRVAGGPARHHLDDCEARTVDVSEKYIVRR
jgi:hypothetical protein